MEQPIVQDALSFFTTFDTELDKNFCSYLRKTHAEREAIFEKLRGKYGHEREGCWASSDALIERILENAKVKCLSISGHSLMRELGNEASRD